ncbi:MAG: hypothetical protein A2675_00565 [Candidatus Yonathbacteria bacterium RIFCSPHIGHO2_01_FULL_51_10]|uniref:Elongation factor Ts n=1 Tax=Candidatus Yonathbacteria bacterium RIFCSPHIGHO2_01_FULL_51_10 TaxID=1802723 RepID=A0A1G2S788_9BACT|nr:MAG: hypothetical protein A2675_00565 [Candidatus Yonathbacteria bacterium RIFCSPHIGHO2_01_FULL_51_10]
MATLDEIKELRDATGISVMQCKKALEEAGGDKEKALALLRKKGSEIASKKSDRELGSGVVSAYIHTNHAVGAMVTLSCETDFVAKNEEFLALAYDIAMHITAMNPTYVSDAQVTPEERAKATELFQKEVDESEKPAEIKEKMMQGKLDAYFKERTLLDQSFVKNQDITVRQEIETAIQKFGERIEVKTFVRGAVAG